MLDDGSALYQENFPFPAIEILTELGHDDLTTIDSGQPDNAILDDQVLRFARSENRILVTQKRKHFIPLSDLYPTIWVVSFV